MRLISMRAALPPMLQASCSIITPKEDCNFSGSSDAAPWPPQRFDWIPGLGCNLAALSVTLEFDKNGRQAGGAVAASVWNAPS